MNQKSGIFDLNECKVTKALDYIRTLHNSNDALEDQPARIGADKTKKKLGLKKEIKFYSLRFKGLVIP